MSLFRSLRCEKTWRCDGRTSVHERTTVPCTRCNGANDAGRNHHNQLAGGRAVRGAARSAKDSDVREYIATFIDVYARTRDLRQVNAALLTSSIHRRMIIERNDFVRTSIRNPEQYDGPPNSVEFLRLADFRKRRPEVDQVLGGKAEVVLYNVGMNYIRSDPYTGMAMLYRYLYIAEHPSRALTLWFPKISEAMWREAATRENRKDVRLFRIAADAILFADQLLPRERL